MAKSPYTHGDVVSYSGPVRLPSTIGRFVKTDRDGWHHVNFGRFHEDIRVADCFLSLRSFQRGDRVRLNVYANADKVGQVGTVDTVNDRTRVVIVRLDRGGYYSTRPMTLDLTYPSPQPFNQRIPL